MANFFHTVPLSRRVAVTPGNINMESLVTIAGIWKGEIPEQQLKLKAVTVSYCYILDACGGPGYVAAHWLHICSE